MNNKHLYLMRGIPGSGKSTIAQMISNATKGVICSTDDYWYNNDEGEYKFDINKVGHAHLVNQRKVAALMADGEESIIVDNTNIEFSSMVPYLNLAVMFEYSVQIIPVIAELGLCKERNAMRPEDRRIPEDVIDAMHKKFRADQAPLTTNNLEHQLEHIRGS